VGKNTSLAPQHTNGNGPERSGKSFVCSARSQQTMSNLLRAKTRAERHQAMCKTTAHHKVRYESTKKMYSPVYVLSSILRSSLNSFLLLMLLALKFTAFLHDCSSRTSVTPAQRHLWTSLTTFAAATHVMEPKHSHNSIILESSSLTDCPDFEWDRVNFPLSSCCVLDLVGE